MLCVCLLIWFLQQLNEISRNINKIINVKLLNVHSKSLTKHLASYCWFWYQLLCDCGHFIVIREDVLSCCYLLESLVSGLVILCPIAFWFLGITLFSHLSFDVIRKPKLTIMQLMLSSYEKYKHLIYILRYSNFFSYIEQLLQDRIYTYSCHWLVGSLSQLLASAYSYLYMTRYGESLKNITYGFLNINYYWTVGIVPNRGF